MIDLEITDVETALIFLREGLARTRDLKVKIAEGKAESPDILYRIDRLEGTVRRFESYLTALRKAKSTVTEKSGNSQEDAEK